MSTAFVNPSVMSRFQRLGQRRSPFGDDEIPLDLGEYIAPAQRRMMMLDAPPADMSGGANFARITRPPDFLSQRNARQPAQDEIPLDLHPLAPPRSANESQQEIPLDGMRLLSQRQTNEIPLELMNQRAVITAPPLPDTSQRAQYSRTVDPDAIAAQRAAYAPGPAQERAKRILAEGPTKHHGSGGWRGVGEHIVDGLKLAGKSLLVSGGNPIAGAMGLVAGTIDPQMEHNFDYNMQLPRVIGQANAEAGLQDENLKRAHQFEAGTGTDFYTGDRTLQGQHYDDMANKYVAGIDATNRRLDQSDEKNAQGWEKINQVYDRQAQTEKDHRIGRMLSAARIPGRSFNQAARDELQKEVGVTLPADFNPMTHDIIKTDKGYEVVQFSKSGAGYTVSPPIAQPPPRATPNRQNKPAVTSGLVSEWTQSGKIDANGMMPDPNPKFTKDEERQIRLAGNDGDALRQKFAAAKRIPYYKHPQFRAEQDKRMGVAGGQGSQGSNAPAQVDAAQQEQMYQQNYSRMSPQKRAEFESLFQQHFGRAPKKPQ